MAPPNQLLFVNFDNAGKLEDDAQRKAVRAHATAYSHRVAPRKGMRAAKYKQLQQAQEAAKAQIQPTPPTSESSGSSASPQLQPAPGTRGSDSVLQLQQPVPVRSYQHAHKRTSQDLSIARLLSPVSAAREKAATDSPPQQITSAHLELSQSARRASEPRKRKRSSISSETQIAKVTKPPPAKVRSHEQLHRVIQFSRLPDVHMLSSSRKDPFETYPVPYEDWYGPALERFYNRLALGTALLKVSKAEIESYISWVRKFEMSDPAVYYTSILLATGTPIALGEMPLAQALPVRGLAVNAINEALKQERPSNALISATGKIALHEHLYGDRNAANTVHRPAQQKMIQLRGGLATLNLPKITVQFMVWYDTFMSMESKTQPYFADVPKFWKGVSSYDRVEAGRVVSEANPERGRHPSFQ